VVFAPPGLDETCKIKTKQCNQHCVYVGTAQTSTLMRLPSQKNLARVLYVFDVFDLSGTCLKVHYRYYHSLHYRYVPSVCMRSHRWEVK